MPLDCIVEDEDERRPIFNFIRHLYRLPRISWRGRAPRRFDGGEHIVHGQDQHQHSLGRLGCLPFELIHMIFLEACTDGGGTGRSLSLVSKDVYRVSRAARFHSVSLLTPSLWKLRHFLQEYGKARDAAIQEDPHGTIPCVRHLCLLVDVPNVLYRDSLDVKPAKQDFRHPEYSLQRGFRNHLLGFVRRRRWGELPEELTLQILQLEVDYYCVVVRLLEQVAGDLFSLCLYQFPHRRGRRGEDPPPLCVRVSSFPKLRELWLGGKDVRDVSLFPQDTSFPALRRLHMRVDFDPDVLHWLSVAPRLDSLRIVAGPNLVTEEKGRQTFMAVAAHPIWREEGKELTIVMPVPPSNIGKFAKRWYDLVAFVSARNSSTPLYDLVWPPQVLRPAANQLSSLESLVTSS